MTASCLSTPLAPVGGSFTAMAMPALAMPAQRRPVRRAGTLWLPVLLVSLSLVALLAPEQPQAQADICQRHNGAAACRVW